MTCEFLRVRRNRIGHDRSWQKEPIVQPLPPASPPPFRGRGAPFTGRCPDFRSGMPVIYGCCFPPPATIVLLPHAAPQTAPQIEGGHARSRGRCPLSGGTDSRPAGFDGVPAIGFWSLEHVKI